MFRSVLLCSVLLYFAFFLLFCSISSGFNIFYSPLLFCYLLFYFFIIIFFYFFCFFLMLFSILFGFVLFHSILFVSFCSVVCSVIFYSLILFCSHTIQQGKQVYFMSYVSVFPPACCNISALLPITLHGVTSNAWCEV